MWTWREIIVFIIIYNRNRFKMGKLAPKTSWIYFGLLCVSLVNVVIGVACPEECTCTRSRMNCSFKKLKTIPTNIPTSVKKLWVFVKHGGPIFGPSVKPFAPNLSYLSLFISSVYLLILLVFFSEEEHYLSSVRFALTYTWNLLRAQ